MAQRRVLLVDGDQDSRTIFRSILLHYGYEVCEAEDGEEGLRLASSVAPDLVILEFPVPLPDGSTLTETLRRDPSTAAVSILTITARALTEDVNRALEAGSDACLTKPVRPQQVVEEVQRLIGPALATSGT